jgi:hypothetical protein
MCLSNTTKVMFIEEATTSSKPDFKTYLSSPKIDVYVNVGEAKLSATHKSLTLVYNDGRKEYIGLNGLLQVLSGHRMTTTIAIRNH